MKNWLDKYDNVPKAQNGIEGTMGGLTDQGFNYNGAWGGTMQTGGSIPGAVGFAYARTQGAAPELADKDEYFRAGYYYNSPARAVNTAEEWGKKSNPTTIDPRTWLNSLSTRERPGVFADVVPNYAEKNELRMSEGSYPYKLMERAKDLGVNVDFDQISELEPVVVRSVNNKKGTKFVPKQKNGGVNQLDAAPIEKLDQLLNFTNYNKPTKGGWLDKYK